MAQAASSICARHIQRFSRSVVLTPHGLAGNQLLAEVTFGPVCGLLAQDMPWEFNDVSGHTVTSPNVRKLKAGLALANY
jgi:hypothetical protein